MYIRLSTLEAGAILRAENLGHRLSDLVGTGEEIGLATGIYLKYEKDFDKFTFTGNTHDPTGMMHFLVHLVKVQDQQITRLLTAATK